MKFTFRIVLLISIAASWCDVGSGRYEMLEFSRGTSSGQQRDRQSSRRTGRRRRMSLGNGTFPDEAGRRPLCGDKESF